MRVLTATQIHLLQALADGKPRRGADLRAALRVGGWNAGLTAWYQLIGRVLWHGWIEACADPAGEKGPRFPRENWYRIAKAGRAALKSFQRGMDAKGPAA